MNMVSGNRLEELAGVLFERLAGHTVDAPDEVLARRDCIVVPSRILQVWLQQHFLYRAPASDIPRTLTPCDFPLLNVFVNDWLYRMDRPEAGTREPATHPFSTESMQWRICRLLGSLGKNAGDEFRPLQTFLHGAGDQPGRRALRRFQLAGRLATMFDSYTVYRPEMLGRWEAGCPAEIPEEHIESLTWEPALWRELTEGLRDQTYLAAFRRMESELAKCGIDEVYPAVHVFCPAILPRVYQVFFQALGSILPVHLYLFNPSPTGWIVDEPVNRVGQAREQIRLEATVEETGLFERENPLLALLGRGIQEYLAEFLDVTGGDSGVDAQEGRRPAPGSVLSALQHAMADNTRDLPAVAGAAEPKADSSAEPSGPPPEAFESLQVHVCHGPRREVEVLRDHLLGWFTKKNLQPRMIQVQVSDMALYAPYIDAVFSTPLANAPDAIPYVVADRIRAGESVVADGFLRLLDLADSRFAAPDIMELLQCDALRRAFGLSPDEVERAHEWVVAAGIRWGRDETHRKKETGIAFTGATTWQYGLDRLLEGYALGRDGPEGIKNAAVRCDRVEGDDAESLGKFARFVDALGGAAEAFAGERMIREWVDELNRVIAEFFRSDNETYLDVAMLRQAVDALRKSSEAADATEDVAGLDVIRAFLRSHVQGAVGGHTLGGNSVVFSALRPGSSAPRAAMCLLGMGDGLFPRPENRPAYDLLRIRRKRCDRTPRIDDRTAFLEAILSARDLLYISYAGYSSEDGSEIPSSILVRELLDTVGEERCAIVRHKLQAFHPDYYHGPGPLFSYSAENRAAAQRLLASSGEPAVAVPRGDPGQGRPAPPVRTTLLLADLLAFARNPVEYYYRHVLGVRLDRRIPVLADSEEFAPRERVGYEVRERVVEAMTRFRAGDEDREAWMRRLQDEGLVPLERWGRQWFEGHWAEVGALLDNEFAEGSGRIRDALVRQQAFAAREELTIHIGGDITITGTPIGLVPGDAPAAPVDFRPSRPKASRKLISFIEHLFACAAGIGETRYCISRKEKARVEVARFRPLADADAKALLRAFVDVSEDGLARPLPFAPETSWAFLDSLRRGKEPDQANASAQDAWYSSNFNHGEDQDSYLRSAFGPDGPMPHPAFAEMAEKMLGSAMEYAR